MSIWDGVERAVKIAGILGGLAAVAALYVQIRDINTKAFRDRIDDWQSATVYEILEEAHGPMSLRDISPLYAAKANNFPEEITRTTLDEAHLRVALIRLIQTGAVVEVNDGAYSVNRPSAQDTGMEEGFTLVMKAMNENNRMMATHIGLMLQVIPQSTSPMTTEQLSQRLISIGGDKTFLQQNMPMLVQQMIQQGQLRYTSDGRLESLEASLARQAIMMPSDPELTKLLPRVDSEIFKYVLFADTGSYSTKCYNDRKDAEELRSGSQVDKLRRLELVKVTEYNGRKDNSGRSCGLMIQIDNTDLLSRLQSYFFTALALQVRPRQFTP
jgi:hypothetical protein